MSTTSSSTVAGRARSCTGCRQVKLACDARRTAPQPCSRCKNKGLQCKFDSNFKRIPMRRVAQEITNELHKLLPTTTSTTASSASPSKSPAAAESHNTPSVSFTGSSDDVAILPALRAASQHHGSSRRWLQTVDNDYYVNYRLGNVEFDADTTVALFQHFERHHLPHAPFIAKIESVYALLMRSPLLFWTIVLIATREHDKHEGVYEQISVAHGVLLSQIAQVAVQTIEEVHALLLLCLWPIPRLREKSDPSWNYVGLATNAAMSLNCHKPSFASTIAGNWRGMTTQTAAEIGSETMAMTWIYCFEIGARVATSLGYPPPLSTDAQLKSVLAATSSIDKSLTEDQKIMTEILRLSCLSTAEVDLTENLETRFSLIQMFDSQLNTIFESSLDIWTLELDVEMLSAKLYLYGLLFAIPIDGSNKPQQRLMNRQLILLRAQNAALQLVSRLMQLSNTPVEDGFYPAGALSFYPKHYFTSLHMAAVFLFRFLASYQGQTPQETMPAVNGLTEAHKVFQSFPDHRDAVKAAIHIEFLVDIIRSNDGSQAFPLAELMITNRLGASIMFDGLFRATHRRNRNPTTGASPPVSNWIYLNDDPRQRLPPTPEQKAATSGTASSNQGTDDGQSQSQSLGPWSGWDSYMNDFEIGELLGGDIPGQIDPAAQAQMYDVANMATLPILGQHQQYPGQ